MDSFKPKDNLTGTERRVLRDPRKNTDLTILPANKENVTVVLNTADYNRKIGALLQDPSYRSLAKGPTERVEHKTSLLLTCLHLQWRFASNYSQWAQGC
jgi:hypothetical protein